MLVLLALLALLASVGCQQTTIRGNQADAAGVACQGSTTEAAEAFYRQIVAMDPRGLPSPQELLALGPMMTSGLQASIERARVRQQSMMAAHPDEKPDFIEGSLFTSLFEGPTRVLGASVIDAKRPARVAVSLEYAQGEAVRWQDQAMMLCEAGRWRVDDVGYAGDWDFATRGSLRLALDGE